jgi:uncharacterized membrane-anchored protein
VKHLNLSSDRQVEPDLLVASIPDHEHHKLPMSRMALPLFLQVLLICSIPFQSVYALITGTTVILKTMPVDPYDILRGYYQTLSYDISRFDTLQSLRGWGKTISPNCRDVRDGECWHLEKNLPVYITLVRNPSINASLPQPWQPVAIDKELPRNLTANRIAIRGVSNGSSIIYGLETYYMPEQQKDVINTDVNQAQSTGQRQNLSVEIKVDHQGLAAPVSLWVGAKKYHF